MSAATESTNAPRDLTALVVAVFERWQAGGIQFLVLRNYEQLPQQTGNDIDILVAPEQLEQTEQLLVTTAQAAGYRCHNRAEFSPVSLFFYHPETLQQVQFDLFYNQQWRGFDLLPARTILDRRLDRGLFSVPHPLHEAVTDLLTRLIYHGYIKENYKSIILAGTRDHPSEMQATLAQIFGGPLAAKMTAAILAERWGEVETHTQALRWQLIWLRLTRQPLATLRAQVSDLMRFLGRFWNPPGLTVVMMGADGSGKSTVAEQVKHALRHSFRQDKSLQIHWKPAVFLRRRRAQRLPTTDPHGQPPRNFVASTIPLIYHWLEFLLGTLIQFHPVLFKNGLVLIDRYHFDFQVDPRRYRLTSPRWLVRSLFWFLPRPDLVYVLDAPVDLLRTRKAEVAVEETRRQTQAYRNLAASLPYAKVLDSSQPLDTVVNKLTRHLLNYMELRLAKRRKHRKRSLCS